MLFDSCQLRALGKTMETWPGPPLREAFVAGASMQTARHGLPHPTGAGQGVLAGLGFLSSVSSVQEEAGFWVAALMPISGGDGIAPRGAFVWLPKGDNPGYTEEGRRGAECDKMGRTP